MRTSRVSTASTARWICEALVTSSVRAVTRLSAIPIGPRLPANTLFAPLRMASPTRARPIPRFAPVIRTVLFAMSIPLWLGRVMGEISFTPYYGPPPAEDTHTGSTDRGYSVCYARDMVCAKLHLSPRSGTGERHAVLGHERPQGCRASPWLEGPLLPHSHDDVCRL